MGRLPRTTDIPRQSPPRCANLPEVVSAGDADCPRSWSLPALTVLLSAHCANLPEVVSARDTDCPRYWSLPALPVLLSALLR